MRISWGKTIVVAIIAAIAVVVFVIKPGQDDQAAAPATSTAPASSQPSAVVSSSTSAAPAEALPSEVQAFADAYASSEGDDAQWLERLRPYVTPALFASLSSSSRDLGRGAGTQILDADDGRVAVGSSAGASYTLAYEQVDVDEDEDAATGGQTVVTGIDFTDPPAGTALPMDTTGGEQFRGPVQDALRVVVARPGDGPTPIGKPRSGRPSPPLRQSSRSRARLRRTSRSRSATPTSSPPPTRTVSSSCTRPFPTPSTAQPMPAGSPSRWSWLVPKTELGQL